MDTLWVVCSVYFDVEAFLALRKDVVAEIVFCSSASR